MAIRCDANRIGETVKVVLALGSPPNVEVPDYFQFSDPFTTILCNRKQVYSKRLADKVRSGKKRGKGMTKYEVHRLDTTSSGQHSCAQKCSQTLKTDLIGFKPHPPTPNSLISYALAQHEQIACFALDHITTSIVKTHIDGPARALSIYGEHPAKKNERSPVDPFIEVLERFILKNLPTAQKYAVLKLEVRILGPPEFIGVVTKPLPGFIGMPLYLGHDDLSHMRFNSACSDPIVNLWSDILARAFELRFEKAVPIWDIRGLHPSLVSRGILSEIIGQQRKSKLDRGAGNQQSPKG